MGELRVGPLNLIGWAFFASQAHERALAFGDHVDYFLSY